jgi:hypothetical protein
MDKRYQVFVSSTYADLKEERSKVIQTIMELDCIPAGMELFPSIDEEQFNFIKKIIDDCDYYLLIIGGRYGSIFGDGVSYTEKEFDYANQKGIKILAFVHEAPDMIPFGKSEADGLIRQKLENFRAKVSANRLIKFWRTAEDLPGLVALSLSKTIKSYPSVGWIRGNSVTNPEILQEINALRKENEQLKAKVAQLNELGDEEVEDSNLAGLSDRINVSGTYFSGGRRPDWEVILTWEEIFFIISPYLLEHPSDKVIQSTFVKVVFEKTGYSGTPSIDDQVFQTVKLHLKALGLINIDYLKTIQGGMGLFWSLTKLGELLMMKLRSVKKT